MRLRTPSDWSATLGFGISGMLILAIAWLVGDGNPTATPTGLLFLAIALIAGIKAAFGTKIPDGAVSYTWRDLGFDGVVAFFSIGMLTFGGLGIASVFAPGATFILPALAWGGIFAGYAIFLLTRRRRTIFTKDKRIMTHVGKPFAFFSRSWKTSNFSAIEATTEWQYAGTLGMISTWRRGWMVIAKGQKHALLMKCDSAEEAQATVEEFSKLTGLPAAPLATTEGPNERHSISP